MHSAWAHVLALAPIDRLGWLAIQAFIRARPRRDWLGQITIGTEQD